MREAMGRQSKVEVEERMQMKTFQEIRREEQVIEEGEGEGRCRELKGKNCDLTFRYALMEM